MLLLILVEVQTNRSWNSVWTTLGPTANPGEHLTFYLNISPLSPKSIWCTHRILINAHVLRVRQAPRFPRGTHTHHWHDNVVAAYEFWSCDDSDDTDQLKICILPNVLRQRSVSSMSNLISSGPILRVFTLVTMVVLGWAVRTKLRRKKTSPPEVTPLLA